MIPDCPANDPPAPAICRSSGPGPITGMAQQLDGKILAFGTFTTISGVAQNRYVRLNADGSRDTSFVLPTATAITSMAVQADGKVIVSGGFNHASVTGTAIIRVESA